MAEMRARIERYRRSPGRPNEDYKVGCLIIEQPSFLPEPDWSLESPKSDAR